MIGAVTSLTLLSSACNLMSSELPAAMSTSSAPAPVISYPGTAFTEIALIAGVPYVDFTSFGSADGISGRFRLPNGIAIDSSYYYLGDTGGHTVRRVSRSTGAIQTIAGLAGTRGTVDGNGSAARFGWPTDLLLSGSTLYVSDLDNHCIRAIDISSPVFPVTTVVGLCGTSGTDDGIGSAARFNQPAGMAKVGGDLYLAEFANHSIRKIQLSNLEVSTVAGTAGVSGASDDIGTLAQFNAPVAMTHYLDPVDGDVLFITDQSNHAIRRLVLSDTSVTTIAGTLAVAGYADGLQSSFRYPWGITSDGSSLYVGDTGNYMIRKISLSDYSVSTLLGALGTTIDVFGSLATARLSTSAPLYFDSQLGLIGTTQSTLFRVK